MMTWTLYLAGAQFDQQGLIIEGKPLSFKNLFSLRNTLREGPGKDSGFFEGRFIFVAQGKVPLFKTYRRTWLCLHFRVMKRPLISACIKMAIAPSGRARMRHLRVEDP